MLDQGSAGTGWLRGGGKQAFEIVDSRSRSKLTRYVSLGLDAGVGDLFPLWDAHGFHHTSRGDGR